MLAGTFSASQRTTLQAAPISAILSRSVQAKTIILAASPHFDAAARNANPNEPPAPLKRAGRELPLSRSNESSRRIRIVSPRSNTTVPGRGRSRPTPKAKRNRASHNACWRLICDGASSVDPFDATGSRGCALTQVSITAEPTSISAPIPKTKRSNIALLEWLRTRAHTISTGSRTYVKTERVWYAKASIQHRWAGTCSCIRLRPPCIGVPAQP